MFERFTREARVVVINAQSEAGTLKHNWVGTEHLLLSMLAVEGVPAALLRQRGITPERVTAAVARHLGNAPGMLGPADAAALRAIGIDLDEVRARLEENFGPAPFTPMLGPPPKRRFGIRRTRREPDPNLRPSGHRPFSARAKKVLELSLRESLRLKQREIRAEHILLGLIREGEGLAALILSEANVDLPGLRAEVEQALKARAA
jgi:ATP-dependent Clp protease ATP-binding subunit ClpA